MLVSLLFLKNHLNIINVFSNSRELYIHILKNCLISMKKLKSLLNSQRTAIFILLILNLLQLRYMGHMREKLKQVESQLYNLENNFLRKENGKSFQD